MNWPALLEAVGLVSVPTLAGGVLGYVFGYIKGGTAEARSTAEMLREIRDTERAIETDDDFVSEAERYRSALREIADMPTPGWRKVQRLAREALDPVVSA